MRSKLASNAHYGMVTQLALHPDNWTKNSSSSRAVSSSSFDAAAAAVSGGGGDYSLSSLSSSSSPWSLRSGLLLTAGLDWSTRLWAIDRSSKASSSSSARRLCEFRGAYEQVEILTVM
jgi:hypothetical protein